MRTETVTYYQFGELSETAQQKAIEAFAGVNVDHDWWQHCYDAAGEAAAMLGISGFEVWSFDTCSGEIAIAGDYAYKRGALKAVRREWPQDAELHRIATALQDAQRRCAWRAEANLRPSSAWRSFAVDVFGSDFDNYADNDVRDALCAFGEWVLSMLRAGYDYLTSEEAIRQTIRANGYEFTEEGRLV